MKMLPIEEQISEIRSALKLQNYRVKKKIVEKQEFENSTINSFTEVFNKFNYIRKYSKNILVRKLNELPENKRYKFTYIDNVDDFARRDVSNYFKIIITNIVSKKENFILVTFETTEFTVKSKQINSDKDLNLDIIQLPIKRFSKTKFRIILFNYILDIIEKDTLTRKRLFNISDVKVDADYF